MFKPNKIALTWAKLEQDRISTEFNGIYKLGEIIKIKHTTPLEYIPLDKRGQIRGKRGGFYIVIGENFDGYYMLGDHEIEKLYRYYQEKNYV